MADVRVAAFLRARAGSNWSIFEDIARMKEPERRAVLRSHREAPVMAEAEITIRQNVDEALNRVMLLELGFEVGLPLQDRDLFLIPGLQTLLGSSAFIRYLDSYLALSVRFVAERLRIPYDGPDRLNERPVARPCPPPIPEKKAAEVDASVLAFLDLEQRLMDDKEIAEALRFLDDYVANPREPLEYELWLRRLSGAANEARFIRITRGLVRFAQNKTAFYEAVERTAPVAPQPGEAPSGAWTARHPLTARFGLSDLYALARLLRAEVSPVGAVTYADGSWLKMLAARAPEVINVSSNELIACELVIQGVLDYTCDLVQNAVEIAEERFEARYSRLPQPVWPSTTVGWRVMYDEELDEIERQRRERQYAGRSAAEQKREIPERPDGTGPQPTEATPPLQTRAAQEKGTTDARPGRPKSIWSRRNRTGEHMDDLVGLAFSGGGIRSATFNLGVLQRLQELDLLRQVDYLSTVSGGGYIGGWLLASVHRSRYWLTRPTDWSESIAHLRRYSNYLAPRSGLMSADTWTMWGSWIRNAALIQVSTVVWLALVMVGVGIGKLAFAWPEAVAAYGAIISVPLLLVAVSIYWNISDETNSRSEQRVIWGAVLPAWATAFLISAVLWAHARADSSTYVEVLKQAYYGWRLPLATVFASCGVLSWRSADGHRLWRPVLAMLAAAFSTGVTYLAACAVYWTYCQWQGDAERHVWYAYAFGPSLILLAMTLGVIVMIGMLGHASPDWRREWWTRFGSWMGIYGAAWLAISAVTILGPYLSLYAMQTDWGAKIKWTVVLGWLGTVVGGLLAGNSTQPDAERARSSKARAVGVFARIAALAFIAGAMILVSTLGHVLLVKISASTDPIDAHAYWKNLGLLGAREYVSTAGVLLVVGLFFSWRFELNIFGLNQFYRNRLVRCYLGATRWVTGLRRPHRFTGFDADDDVQLSDLRHTESEDPPYRGPFPLLNCALNLGGSSDLALHTRHSASFVMTPLRCGADRPSVGYAPSRTDQYSFAGGVNLGQAVAVSGAAASPNMGYDTSPLVAFLLTMFNVRLAWWFPNPGRRLWWASWLRFSLVYLVRETFALADEDGYFVNVSDGGHFENLGIYELIRRRCQVIIAADAECDEALAFGSLGRVVRMCQTDFGANIEIDVESIRRQKDSTKSRAHCTVGRITYANGSRGFLIYLKASISGDESIDVQQYLGSHPAFPHESTGDQFFAEDQFESYRTLGHHITEMAFRGVERDSSIVAMAGKLANLWTPASAASAGFVKQTEALVALWDRLRATPALLPLFSELHALDPNPTPHEPTEEELCVCLELIQLMENTFIELRLDEFWRHPDNQGWVALFTMWAQSPTFRDAWRQYRNVFGIRFGYFCRQRLGL